MVPLISQSSPSLTAVVDSRWVLDPASGSVIAKTMMDVPADRAGSHDFRCSSVPKAVITSPQMAVETTSKSSGVPWAAISSPTIDSSLIPPPPPPYSSGRLTPMNPAPASRDHSSVHGSRAAACSA